MAFTDWIKIEHTTPDKQEIILMADALGIDVDAVFGKVMRFWIWADQNTENGNLNLTSCAYIDRMTFCNGFAAAMIKVGWLAKEGERIIIPNFDYHMSESAKKRARNVKRQRTSRGKCDKSVTDVTEMSQVECDKSVTPSSSSSMSPSLSSEEGGLGEETKLEAEEKLFQDLPLVLASETFKASWRQWERYLKEVHCKPMQPMMRSPAWQGILERAPPGKEVEFGLSTIRDAMANGWKGLHPKEEKSHGRRSNNTRNPTKSAGGGQYEGLKPVFAK